jgi:hypothetical protein
VCACAEDGALELLLLAEAGRWQPCIFAGRLHYLFDGRGFRSASASGVVRRWFYEARRRAGTHASLSHHGLPPPDAAVAGVSSNRRQQHPLQWIRWSTSTCLSMRDFIVIILNGGGNCSGLDSSREDAIIWCAAAGQRYKCMYWSSAERHRSNTVQIPKQRSECKQAVGFHARFLLPS